VYALLAFLAPLALIAAAVFAFRGPAFRPTATVKLAEIAALAAFAVSALVGVLLLVNGAATSPTLGISSFGLGTRVDVLSVIMMLLVSFVGWVVLRFSGTYLDGEAKQGPFTGWMLLTLASVLLLVQSGTLVQLVLAWIAPASSSTSFFSSTQSGWKPSERRRKNGSSHAPVTSHCSRPHSS
jgi:NAD(P)H-quinone oxidoreductase subunit 5